MGLVPPGMGVREEQAPGIWARGQRVMTPVTKRESCLSLAQQKREGVVPPDLS